MRIRKETPVYGFSVQKFLFFSLYVLNLQALREDAQIEEEQNSRKRSIQQMIERTRWLEQQIADIRERHAQTSQVHFSAPLRSLFKLYKCICNYPKK